MNEDHDETAPEAAAATVTDLFSAAGKHHTGSTQPAQREAPQEVFHPMRIADLKEHDRVLLYGTIVTITGEPYTHTALEGECELQPGWVHVPMIWDGFARATGERGDDLVAVSRQVHA